MKCRSESYLTEEVYLTSVGGKGSSSTPSPKDRGHNLGVQVKARGVGREAGFCEDGECS